METENGSEVPEQNIMIVDDRPANLQVLVEFLRREGYKVRPVTSGAAALSVASQVRPDLVLLDVNMPGMSGYDVCRQIKGDAALCDVPVLFLSAMNEPLDKVKAFEAGGQDYITKPFEMEEVKARIGTHLRLSRLRGELAARLAQIKSLAAMREHLVHMLVHDMRSPLFSVAGMLELAGMCPSVAHDPEAGRYIAEARGSTRAVVEMISDILDVYKMESGHALTAPRPTPVVEIIDHAVRLLGGLLKASHFCYEPPPASLTVMCDPSLTGRVVLNLLGNAIKFSKPGGRLDVTVTDGPAEVRVAVQDEGPGIREADLVRVFEKFGELESRRSGRKYSTGLGLVFCKMIVESQGGRIGVESTVGKGSTFWFTLPKPSGEQGGNHAVPGQ